MSARAIAAPQRRGTCPGLSDPMPTGDGLLVRLRPLGTVPLDAFAQLCAAARRHGNGVIEITSRGSIQVRGLSAASAPRFAAGIAALNIAAADGVPILCNPLAGLAADELFDAAALAEELRHALAQTSLAQKLSAKISVVIDGGGALNLATVPADIRLSSEKTAGDIALRVGIGGDNASAADLGLIAPAHGAEVAMRLLEFMAQHGRNTRARDIVADEGIAEFHSAIADLLLSARPRESGNQKLASRVRGNERKTSSPIGRFRLHDGSLACGIGLAFGHADATILEQLADAANAAGASGFRAASGRALLAPGLAPNTAAPFVAAAEQLGFIVRADDPRRAIVACAGAPVCASAYIASRELAPRIAGRAAFTVHISGCAKGCAQAAPAALTVVGTPEGCALIANGSVRDAPFAVVTSDDLPTAIANVARQATREADHV
jgi:precorrin-3B synthase